MGFEAKECHEGKFSEDRNTGTGTVIVCASMDDTEKFSTMIIWKFDNPRFLNSITSSALHCQFKCLDDITIHMNFTRVFVFIFNARGHVCSYL